MHQTESLLMNLNVAKYQLQVIDGFSNRNQQRSVIEKFLNNFFL